MNKKGILLILCLLFQTLAFANSVSLLNDSIYTLRAKLYDATGTLLGEFILNPRDAADWNDNQMDFGTQNQSASQTPYSVNWTCLGGGPYGSCNNVAAGSVVTAQSCGGNQQCKQPQSQNP